MRSRQIRIKGNVARSMLSMEPWDLYYGCVDDNDLAKCREVCTAGWSDDWFVPEEITESCGKVVTKPPSDAIYDACVDDFNTDACSYTCFYGAEDPWFLKSEIMKGCLVIGFTKGGMDLNQVRDAVERVAGQWIEQGERHQREDEELAMETFLELGPHVKDGVQVVGDMVIDSIRDRADAAVDAISEQADREV